ncbi:MAG TPA: ribonuclease HI [Candidatus Aphodoplasma excrementigallinarum]|uniref:Ribonuclease H n=1 Tax=Candidatus Aphodoplasma excrementigallinarum TaxID=2840673 RepID=A0A9D1NGJ8_9FIRM|nr:ribonuclease HI [Candidatus Aphodoplasma excrementigallinarum]
MKEVLLFTDGACSGNPGKGGYGAILKYGSFEKEMSRGFVSTTNNRMELLAAIVGLEALKEPCIVDLYSDSKYLVDAVNKGWVYNWKKNGWKKSDKKSALNVDLWERLLALMETHRVTFHWVKGHDGHPENERCDRLAVLAYMGTSLYEDKGFVNS